MTKELYTKFFEIMSMLGGVLIFFLICAALFKYFQNYMLIKIIPNGHKKHLKIHEILVVDDKRRVIRLQDQTHEHLIFLGPQNDFCLKSHPIGQDHVH